MFMPLLSHLSRRADMPNSATAMRAAHSRLAACLNLLAGPEQAVRRAMQALASRPGDPHQLAELNAGLLVARDHVGLHHQAHVLAQRERCGVPCRAAL